VSRYSPKGCVTALAILGVLRRLSRRSGATDAESHGSLPGDDVIPHPMVEWTRATTIPAPPDVIWPWLVQMGYGRGGWYTSERFDRIVWRIKNVSADEILDEWQHLSVRDIVPDGPGYAAYFRVLEVSPQESIVYRSIRHPYRGHPVDPTDRDGLQRLEQRLVQGGVYLDFTWAFALRPIDRQRTRLIIRTRANFHPGLLRCLEVPLGLVDLYHVSTMFSGIRRRVRDRAEDTA
jgi:hypothetical protein